MNLYQDNTTSEKIPFFTKKILPTMMAAALASTAQVYNVYDANGTELNVDIEAMFGVFSSDRNYDTLGTKQAGSSAWQEGYLKYGLSGSHVIGDNNSSVYGAVNDETAILRIGGCEGPVLTFFG